MSLDGRVGLTNGKSKWISNEESRQSVHLLRSKCDAIIVGARTVRIDNPLLTSRGLISPEPLRVILTNSLNIPNKAQILDTSIAKTLIAYGPEASSGLVDEFPHDLELMQLRSSEPIELLKALSEKGCNKVLWECGPTLATAALKQNCVQELKVVIAPKILGGVSAMTPFEEFGFTSMSEVLSMNNISLRKVGGDLHLSMHLP